MNENHPFAFLDGLNRFGWRLGLDNISQLLAELGNPHQKFPSVHIAGTNGKGSTAAFLESICQHAGFRTGLYTSPHLREVTERIRVNGRAISKGALATYLRAIRSSVEKLGATYFETLTAVAFCHFAEEKVELAFIEVGLGGRFDATNVISPELSVITNVDLDHMQHLGQSRAQIAAEKAGIIKHGIAVLSGCADEGIDRILAKKAREQGADLFRLFEECAVQVDEANKQQSSATLIFADEKYRVKIGLAGEHQICNAALATQAVRLLRTRGFMIPNRSIHAGLQNVHWPGRLEIVRDSPQVVIDVAHNVGAITQLIQALNTLFVYDQAIFLLGLLQDKDFGEIARLIATVADFVITIKPNSERGLDQRRLASEITGRGVQSFPCASLSKAYAKARALASPDDVICITGSHYLVGEFLNLYEKS